MAIPSGKKILLIGFVIVLLIAIPITVFLVQQQQKTQSSAVAATTLSLTPAAVSAPVDGDISMDVTVNPSTNLVSFIKLLLTYDATKLATSGAGFVPNTTAFPSVLAGPVYGPGTVSVTVSIGGSPQNAIQATTKVGTITFKALSATDTAPTQVTFGGQTQVLSIGTQDQFNENVLSTTSPASITITESEVAPTETPVPTETPEPTDTPEPTETPEPTDTPEPTVGPGTPTPTPGVTTPTPTTAPSTGAGPTCTSLTLDRSSTGTVPYNLNLTAVGNSSDGTISKVTFDFGDGQVSDVTDAGGIGTNSVSVVTSHIYNAAGSFTAKATLTDDSGFVSSGGCSVLVTVSAEGTPTVTLDPSAAPSPLPPTGPASIISLGAIGAFLAIIGIILIFAL